MEKTLGLILFHLVFYLIGSFIASDFNPLNWWMFASWVGRVTFLIFEVYVISNFIEEF